MKRTYPCLSILLALSLGAYMPISAYAEEPGEPSPMHHESGSSDPSDFGSDYVAPQIDRTVLKDADLIEPTVAGGDGASSQKGDFIRLSDEIKYYLKYESSQNYDAGLSYYDGYHALGYYQWDNTANLQPFITYCYNYDPETFSMFAPYIMGAGLSLADYETWEAEKWNVDAAWHAAYKADPDVFAGLQDTYSYNTVYLPAERDLKRLGIDISGRADCIKGLCWGVANLFGLTGWHRFTGGTILVYDDNGNVVEKEMPGCGLDNRMSDAQFAKALCTYIADNVAAFYPKQPQYHEGWANRYRSELQDCYRYLGVNSEGVTDLVAGSWYYDAMNEAIAKGYITGYSDKPGTYGPTQSIKRCDAVTILWRIVGKPHVSSLTSRFNDVNLQSYYGWPVAWASQNAVINGSSLHSDGTYQFRPGDLITREEAAKIIANYAELIGENVEGCDTSVLASGRYADADKVSNYARAPFAWAVQNEIITGKENVYLAPHDTCTRAELVTMLMRFQNVIAKKQGGASE